jgi:hypothetical protein
MRSFFYAFLFCSYLLGLVRALVAFLLANASYRCTKGRSGVWVYVVVTIPAMAGFGRFCQLAPLELDMQRQYQLDFMALVQSLAKSASGVFFAGHTTLFVHHLQRLVQTLPAPPR